MPVHPENIGPYRITGKLGEGGMGIVYSAHDSRLDRAVALKMILASGDDESGRKRFLREAQAAARVNHPNICRLYDIGEEGGRPFLVMELLEGEPLASRLMRGPMLVPEAVQIILSVLSALSALHRCSIVHRDLKPSNVFLSTQGVKLLDFGLAKPVASPQTSDSATEIDLTQPGAIAATPRYASPEQLTGKPVDARSDLFSAASMLFEMLAAKQAFQGGSQIEIFHAILYESPPPLSGSPAASAVDRILHRAMAKAAEGRFQDADAMAAELRAVMRLEDTSARVEARSIKKLIVLPFRALRADPDTDFLAFESSGSDHRLTHRPQFAGGAIQSCRGAFFEWRARFKGDRAGSGRRCGAYGHAVARGFGAPSHHSIGGGAGGYLGMVARVTSGAARHFSIAGCAGAGRSGITRLAIDGRRAPHAHS